MEHLWTLGLSSIRRPGFTAGSVAYAATQVLLDSLLFSYTVLVIVYNKGCSWETNLFVDFGVRGQTVSHP